MIPSNEPDVETNDKAEKEETCNFVAAYDSTPLVTSVAICW